MRKTFIFSSLLVVGTLLGACSSDSATNAPVASATATPASTATPVETPAVAARTVTGTSTVENKDGSTTLVTTYSDGSKTEVRTFKDGTLAKVTRETSVSGTRTARVTYRADSSDVEVEDKNWIEKSMEATGNALSTAARKTKSGVKTGINETGDKAEDVGDATKKGAKKVGEKAVEVGSDVKSGAKKLGSKIKDAVTPDKKEKN